MPWTPVPSDGLASSALRARAAAQEVSGRDRIGRERGWPPVTWQQYEHDIEHGSLYVSSPDTVADKIAATVATVGGLPGIFGWFLLILPGR